MIRCARTVLALVACLYIFGANAVFAAQSPGHTPVAVPGVTAPPASIIHEWKCTGDIDCPCPGIDSCVLTSHACATVVQQTEKCRNSTKYGECKSGNENGSCVNYPQFFCAYSELYPTADCSGPFTCYLVYIIPNAC